MVGKNKVWNYVNENNTLNTSLNDFDKIIRLHFTAKGPPKSYYAATVDIKNNNILSFQKLNATTG